MEIVCGSRLHFGLLHVPQQAGKENGQALKSMRLFGGAGLMIEEPALRLEAHPAKVWSAQGVCADQILAIARAYEHALGSGLCMPLAFQCHTAPPRHAGFGSGTQLALAVARLLSEASGEGSIALAELARRTGRGRRSGIGAHGFAQGGFLVEAGKVNAGRLATLIARHPFPENWTIVLIQAPSGQAVHGAEENERFLELSQEESEGGDTDELCKIVLTGLLPALIDGDHQTFSESLYQFNRKAGERFAGVQGGAFASGQVSDLIDALRKEGCPGAGQSSWGPAVFAICRDRDQGNWIAKWAGRSNANARVIVTRARNSGASLQ